MFSDLPPVVIELASCQSWPIRTAWFFVMAKQEAATPAERLSLNGVYRRINNKPYWIGRTDEVDQAGVR